MEALGPLFELFYFRQAQRDSAEKTSKFGLDMSQGRKNQNYVIEYFLHISVLVIDCY
jgi:hypothetical protein